MFLEKSNGTDNTVKGSMACFVFTVDVMKFLWAIETEAYKKIILVKELAPLVIQEYAIRLESIFDTGTWFLIQRSLRFLLLQFCQTLS